MSEEEKQAIDILNTFIFRQKTKNYNKLSLEDTESVKVVLNLIDKQQKQIEKLKSRKYILNAETQEIKEIPIDDNYISKDKIREKMNEIMSYTISSSEERHCQNYAYDRLKELLGEENE